MILGKREFEETIDTLREEARHASDYHVSKNSKLESMIDDVMYKLGGALMDNENQTKVAHNKISSMEARLDNLDLLLQQLLTCFSVTHIPAQEAETIPGDYVIAHEKMNEAIAAGRTVEIKIGPKAARTIVELKKKR